MIAILSNGTNTNVIHPGSINQNSHLATEILFIGPFSATSVVLASFTLPNGMKLVPRWSEIVKEDEKNTEIKGKMTLIETEHSLNVDGQTLNAWFLKLDRGVTQFHGTLKISFNIFNGNSEQISTQEVGVTINRATAYIPEENENGEYSSYDEIQGLLSDLITREENNERNINQHTGIIDEQSDAIRSHSSSISKMLETSFNKNSPETQFVYSRSNFEDTAVFKKSVNFAGEIFLMNNRILNDNSYQTYKDCPHIFAYNKQTHEWSAYPVSIGALPSSYSIVVRVLGGDILLPLLNAYAERADAEVIDAGKPGEELPLSERFAISKRYVDRHLRKMELQTAKDYLRLGSIDNYSEQTFHGNLKIDGNLTVDGTITKVNVEELEVKDAYIITNSHGLAGLKTGIILKTGENKGYGLVYDTDNSVVKIGEGTFRKYSGETIFTFDENQAQPLATRGDIKDGHLALWDGKNFTFTDSGIPRIDECLCNGSLPHIYEYNPKEKKWGARAVSTGAPTDNTCAIVARLGDGNILLPHQIAMAERNKSKTIEQDEITAYDRLAVPKRYVDRHLINITSLLKPTTERYEPGSSCSVSKSFLGKVNIYGGNKENGFTFTINGTSYSNLRNVQIEIHRVEGEWASRYYFNMIGDDITSFKPGWGLLTEDISIVLSETATSPMFVTKTPTADILEV